MRLRTSFGVVSLRPPATFLFSTLDQPLQTPASSRWDQELKFFDLQGVTTRAMPRHRYHIARMIQGKTRLPATKAEVRVVRIRIPIVGRRTRTTCPSESKGRRRKGKVIQLGSLACFSGKVAPQFVGIGAEAYRFTARSLVGMTRSTRLRKINMYGSRISHYHTTIKRVVTRELENQILTDRNGCISRIP